MPVDAAKERELFASLFGDEDDSGEPPKLAPEAPKSVLDEDLALSDDELSESEILDEGDKAPVLEAETVPSVGPPAKEEAVKPQEKKRVMKQQVAPKKSHVKPKPTTRKQKEREQAEKVLTKLNPRSKAIVKSLPPIPRVVTPPTSASPPSTQAQKASSLPPTSSAKVSPLAKTTKVKDKASQSPVVRQAAQGTQTEQEAQGSKANTMAVFHVHRFGTSLGFKHFYGSHEPRGLQPLLDYICRNMQVAPNRLPFVLKKRRWEIDDNLPHERVYSIITGTVETGCRLSKTPCKLAHSPFGDVTLAEQIKEEYGLVLNGDMPLVIFGHLKLPLESLYKAY